MITLCRFGRLGFKLKWRTSSVFHWQVHIRRPYPAHLSARVVALHSAQYEIFVPIDPGLSLVGYIIWEISTTEPMDRVVFCRAEKLEGQDRYDAFRQMTLSSGSHLAPLHVMTGLIVQIYAMELGGYCQRTLLVLAFLLGCSWITQLLAFWDEMKDASNSGVLNAWWYLAALILLEWLMTAMGFLLGHSLFASRMRELFVLKHPRELADTATRARHPGLCVVCCDVRASHAFYPCNHLAVCRDCCEAIMSTTQECPSCSHKATSAGQIFFC